MSPIELTERAEELLDAYADWYRIQAEIEAKEEQQHAIASAARKALKALGLHHEDWLDHEIINLCAKVYADFRTGRLDHLLDGDHV